VYAFVFVNELDQNGQICVPKLAGDIYSFSFAIFCCCDGPCCLTLLFASLSFISFQLDLFSVGIIYIFELYIQVLE